MSTISKLPILRALSAQGQCEKENIDDHVRQLFCDRQLRTEQAKQREREIVKRDREDFALYLANMDRTIKVLYSRRGNVCAVAAFLMDEMILLTFAYTFDFLPLYKEYSNSNSNWHLAGVLVMVLVATFIVSFSIGCGRVLGWHWRMGGLARQIREDCLCGDLEKGSESSEEKLAAFIEELLKEENDELSVIEERGRGIRVSIRGSRPRASG